jgi:hypothetical protein
MLTIGFDPIASMRQSVMRPSKTAVAYSPGTLRLAEDAT